MMMYGVLRDRQGAPSRDQKYVSELRRHNERQVNTVRTSDFIAQTLTIAIIAAIAVQLNVGLTLTLAKSHV